MSVEKGMAICDNYGDQKKCDCCDGKRKCPSCMITGDVLIQGSGICGRCGGSGHDTE